MDLSEKEQTDLIEKLESLCPGGAGLLTYCTKDKLYLVHSLGNLIDYETRLDVIDYIIRCCFDMRTNLLTENAQFENRKHNNQMVVN